MTTLQGSWIWYELMTPDPAGAKAFYDAVVGWSIVPGTPQTNDYGFIANADGGMTGGVLRLTREMTDHGARPCWLGYIGVDDVDASHADHLSDSVAGEQCRLLVEKVEAPVEDHVHAGMGAVGQGFVELAGFGGLFRAGRAPGVELSAEGFDLLIRDADFLS